MIAYTQTEINLMDLWRREDEEDAIDRRVAWLRLEFERAHPDYKMLPYIVARRLNTDRQVIELRICAPADEELAMRRRTGDRGWEMKQFVIAS